MSSPNAKERHSRLERLLIGLHRRLSHGRRVERLVAALGPLVPPAAALLDLGCGDLTLADGLRRARGSRRCVGADVWPSRVAPPQGCEYRAVEPGRPLPFADREFDVVLLVDTLHHLEDPAPLLREALRVGRRVLVKDHFEYGPASRLLLQALDWAGNHAYGVPIPGRYFTPRSFEALVRAVAPGLEPRPQVGLDLYAGLPLLGRLLPPRLHFIAVLPPG